ncbi:MAG: methyltransferase [Isosphaeraceae bacterium]
MSTTIAHPYTRGDRGVAQPRGPVVASTARRHFLFALAVDWSERILLSGLFTWQIYRMFGDFYGPEGSIVSFALLPSVTLLMFCTLTRRTTTRFTRKPLEWAVAMAASLAPFCFTPHAGAALIPASCGIAIIFSGLLIDLYSQFFLGRSFGCIPANRGLKLGGPYRFVRHPMYAGYLVSHTGFVLLNATWLNLMVFAACYLSQIPRLLLEERLLGEELPYREYMEQVRYRLVPGIF